MRQNFACTCRIEAKNRFWVNIIQYHDYVSCFFCVVDQKENCFQELQPCHFVFWVKKFTFENYFLAAKTEAKTDLNWKIFLLCFWHGFWATSRNNMCKPVQTGRHQPIKICSSLKKSIFVKWGLNKIFIIQNLFPWKIVPLECVRTSFEEHLVLKNWTKYLKKLDVNKPLPFLRKSSTFKRGG